MILDTIIELISEHTGTDVSEITADTTFEALGIDSLDTVEMVMELEEKLDMTIELEDKVFTVGELASFVEGLQK